MELREDKIMENKETSCNAAFVPQPSTLQIDGLLGPLGVGFYPRFNALWHLKDLGIASNIAAFTVEGWQDIDPERPIRVAMLDTAVAWEHPNLESAVDLGLMRDFQSDNDGLFVVPPVSKADKTSRRWVIDRVEAKVAAVLKDMSHGAKAAITGQRTLPTPESVGPAAHGTAVAGLIGARPARINLRLPIETEDNKVPGGKLESGLPLPYSGINPFCRIVPISTTAAPDPAMILAALQYARLIKAQILVIAAAWEDSGRTTEQIGLQPGKHVPEWKDVEAELDRLAEDCIILCAAGNSGKDALAYPASLSNRVPKLYAVTACKSDGTPVSYTAKPSNVYKTLSTLGGEAPRYDRARDLVDPWAIRDFDPGRTYERDGTGQLKTEYVPVERLISLDPPGPVGANPSPYAYTPRAGGEHLEIGSLFAEFNGTSAAVAIAAGLISLVMQSEKTGENKQSKPGQGSAAEETWFNLTEAKTKFDPGEGADRGQSP
jgi:Subtilase family